MIPHAKVKSHDPAWPVELGRGRLASSESPAEPLFKKKNKKLAMGYLCDIINSYDYQGISSCSKIADQLLLRYLCTIYDAYMMQCGSTTASLLG